MLLILGLLLVGAVAAFTVGVLLDNDQDVAVEVFGHTDFLTVAGVYLVGAVSALVLAVGLSLVVSGWSRRHRRRKERKVQARTEASERAELEERNEQLQQQLAQSGHAAVEQEARSGGQQQSSYPAYPEDSPASADSTPAEAESGGRRRSRR